MDNEVKDSRLVYIMCHMLTHVKNLLVFSGIAWLTYVLKEPWVILALAICPWSKYLHDYGRTKEDAYPEDDE